MASISEFKKEMDRLKNPEKGIFLQRFFKTGVGQYGHGDVFFGITVPQQRIVATKFKELNLSDLKAILSSKIHEYRLTALIILVAEYKKSGAKGKKPTARREIVKFYLANRRNINNWDLVDSSAPYILGDYYLDKDKTVLYRLAKSKNLWDKRIAIISTQGFIRKGEFQDTFEIAKILLNDPHDLLHKAVGWMLREVGNRDLAAEEKFLKVYAKQMPRTMLRYAIEKFPEAKRKSYMLK